MSIRKFFSSINLEGVLMSSSNDQEIIPGKKTGIWDGLTNYFKLIARLMVDRRVNPFLKVLPVGTLIYLAVPDLIPFVIDDALVIWLGTYLFIELCPPEVVAEHRTALESGETENAKPTSSEEEAVGEVIDAEYWEELDDET